MHDQALRVISSFGLCVEPRRALGNQAVQRCPSFVYPSPMFNTHRCQQWLLPFVLSEAMMLLAPFEAVKSLASFRNDVSSRSRFSCAILPFCNFLSTESSTTLCLLHSMPSNAKQLRNTIALHAPSPVITSRPLPRLHMSISIACPPCQTVYWHCVSSRHTAYCGAGTNLRDYLTLTALDATHKC